LAFREFSLRVRLLANILGEAPHSRSESCNHRVSFLAGYTFFRGERFASRAMACREEMEGLGKNQSLNALFPCSKAEGSGNAFGGAVLGLVTARNLVKTGGISSLAILMANFPAFLRA
jgi:hypothetical protein